MDEDNPRFTIPITSDPRGMAAMEVEASREKIQAATNVEEDEVNDNPIEQVRLTVPITDDPTESTLTFRTWVLGLLSCCVLSFVNQFFAFRQNQLSISSVSAQIVVLPLGKLMAATLPKTNVRVPFTPWSFSLNPGPFTMKEHVLITIFANCGAGGVYAVNIITIVKAFYRRPLHPVAAMLLAQTTQLLGYGWAGLFRKVLVDSPYMWWPITLVQVSLFRTLHEKEKRPKGGHTRLQFFIMVFISSFAYYIIPGYFFQSISALSFVCLIWKDSILIQQIGSGLNGYGVGSFGLDWATVASFLGSPLATPLFAICNVMVGFVLFLYVLIPIAYQFNLYEARKFPLISSHTFDADGQTYNISRILNQKTFDINLPEYNSYSKLYLSVAFAFLYGLSFATLSATISHVFLFEGNTILEMWRKTTYATKDKFNDIHTRLMKKNYEAVPQWWFIVILITVMALSIFACEGFGKELQLPWWGVLLACLMALFFTLPVGIIQATTNMAVGLNVITELVIGYLYPGKPLANVSFKTYGYISMVQALMLLSDFKLGHYMKIPPKSMFFVQLVGTVVASTCYFGTAWWLLSSIENICNPALLPEGSPWTCPGDDVFYNASIIWGVVGPLRMFTKYGNYKEMNWFFLIGLLAPVPVWLLSRMFPEKKWIKLIHMPMILGATMSMPPAKAVHYICWGTVGIFFNWYVYSRYKRWWAKHTYVLSAALDAGVAFMAVVLYFTLQSYNVSGPEWWGLEGTDHCDLAHCPTFPGVVSEGCPAV
ncbi:Oligopeptide transporter 2 [Hibiscus syriacus]|uniref:Oligopeptide transporter 2 n=1 Tax=Hibiscus syriacus TaxID=106335 RepID=A0A6A2ZJ42_HIBSY|nr:oligopeptide transporter 1-like [Hibiscus syriacus]KAE8691152.1 Oligopeptide transporter 2 [Hibiscus syriacus]